MLHHLPTLTTPIDCTVVKCVDGMATIQMQVPEQYIMTLPVLLNSLNDALRLLRFRTKNAVAQARAEDPVEQAKRLERARKFDESILKRFDEIRPTVCTDRECIRQTGEYFRNSGLHITNYTVEITARQAGRFRKPRKTKA